MRFAYADPPYPGMSRKHYKDHRDYGGEVDHAELVTRLERDYDAWVLHTSATAFRDVLALCPPVRIGVWVKNFAIYKPHVPIAYAWEPVLFRGRRPRPVDMPTITDYVIAPVTLRKGTAGAKPPVVCRWAFDMLGLLPDDDLHDLFPGSGAVSEAWEGFRQAPRLRQIDWTGPRRHQTMDLLGEAN